MACFLKPGPREWSGSVDDEGYYEYRLKSIVTCSTLDGPANALRTPGLPLSGAIWQIDNDIDVWAWCRPGATATPMAKEGDPNQQFIVENRFSSKPDLTQKCYDQNIQDPLLQPQKVTGGFARFDEEATHDRFGERILNSAWEQIRGDQVKFDQVRGTIKIEQNVAILNQAIFEPMRNTVNMAPLWGFPARSIRLANSTWEPKFYGLCYKYYTRIFEFEIWVKWVLVGSTWVLKSGWDRDLLDEATKALRGHWNNLGKWVLDNIGGNPPDPNNPSHFIRVKDSDGENMRVILNGAGVPYDPGDTDTSKYWCIKHPSTPSCFQGSQAQASAQAAALTIPPMAPIQIAGPYATEGACTAACTLVDPPPTVPPTSGEPGTIHVEKYDESNFLLLGIPLIF